MPYFGLPTHVVSDQAFISSLMVGFVTQLNIKIIILSPTNHKALQAEHGIKSLSNLLVKHLSEVWSYNANSSPNLDSYSPFELVFGHKMALSLI